MTSGGATSIGVITAAMIDRNPHKVAAKIEEAARRQNANDQVRVIETVAHGPIRDSPFQLPCRCGNEWEQSGERMHQQQPDVEHEQKDSQVNDRAEERLEPNPRQVQRTLTAEGTAASEHVVELKQSNEPDRNNQE